MERTEITILKPTLTPEGAGVYLWCTLFRMILRTTVIWAGFAILVPGLGIAWYMVLIALVMLNHLLWRPSEEGVIAANKLAADSKTARDKKKAVNSTKTDNQLFSQRVNS